MDQNKFSAGTRVHHKHYALRGYIVDKTDVLYPASGHVFVLLDNEAIGLWLENETQVETPLEQLSRAFIEEEA